MRIVVTGANGGVGSALVTSLREKGEDVVPAVRVPHGIPGEKVCGEIDGTTDWASVLEGSDVVIHLAARVHVMKDTSADPLDAFRKVNVQGTATLARHCAAAGVRRLVFMSTIKVNGEHTASGRPFRPTDASAPTDPYAISKVEAEREVQDICGSNGMEWVIVRPPLIYGRNVGGNFAALVNLVRRGIPLPLGIVTRNRRSLVAMGNVVDFLETAAVHDAAANQIFLVSDAEAVSTAALLRALSDALGKSPRLLPVPPSLLRFAAGLVGRSAEADRLLQSLELDISKARELLGWIPPISLERGLRQAVAGQPQGEFEKLA
jgi:nucleoside-diphosphate-sugar epimerase